MRRLLQPLQEPPPLRGIVGVAGRKRKSYRCPGIRGNPVKFGVPSAPGPADALDAFFLEPSYRRGAPHAGAVKAQGLDPGPDHLQVREAGMAPLPRQQRRNAPVLFWCEFHLPAPPQCSSRK